MLKIELWLNYYYTQKIQLDHFASVILVNQLSAAVMVWIRYYYDLVLPSPLDLNC